MGSKGTLWKTPQTLQEWSPGQFRWAGMSLDGITDSEVVTASLPFMLYPQLPLSQTQSSQRFPLEQGLCLPMDLSSAVWALIPTKPAKDRANCDREA